MESRNTVEYTCPLCGHLNLWTRDEILRRGDKEVYRGESDTYSLPCKRPGQPTCTGRFKVIVEAEAT